MYNFVFWFFYRFFEWRKGFQSSFLSASMVAFVLLIHLGLLYSIIRYFTGFSFTYLTGSYGQRKYMLLPFMLLLFFLVYLIFYKNRTTEVLEKYGDNKFSSAKNIVLVLLITVVPLIAAIILTNAVV